MRKILIIESCPGVPHTDMSLEIAVREKELGNKVFYSPIYPNNLVWEYSMMQPNADHRALAGVTYQISSKILNHLGIPIVDIPDSINFNKSDYESYVLSGEPFQGKWDLKTVVTSSVSATLHKAEPDLKSFQYREVGEIFTRAAINTYWLTRKLIEIINPDLIYFYAGRWATCIPIKWACIDLGVDSLSHERGADNNRFMLYDKEAYASYEHMRRIVKKSSALFSKDIIRLVGADHYRSKRSGTETIWPSFVAKQVQGNLPSELRNKNFVCYFTSSEDEFSQIPGNKVESYFGKQFEAFQLLKNICSKLGQHLVVRVHPNVAYKHEEEEAFWSAQKSEFVTVIDSKSTVDTYSLIEESRVVVTYATTVGMEAIYWGKPSILLGNSPWYDEFGFYCPRNLSELAEMIMSARYKDSPFIYQFAFYLENFGFKFRHYKPISFFSGKIFGNNLHPFKQGF